MRDGQVKILVVLVALAIAVGLVAFLGQSHPRPQGGALYDPEATVDLWAFGVEEVSSARLQRGEEVIAIEQREGAWWLLGETDAPADDERVRWLTAWLADAGKAVAVPDAQPADHGLEPPRATIAFAANGTAYELHVGDRTATGRRTFVRVADGPVVAVPGDFWKDVWEERDNFRTKRLVTYRPAEVRGVSLASKHGVLSVSGEGRDWWLDGFARADTSKIDFLVYGLLEVRFAELMPGIAPDGIAKPAVAVRVTLADGSVVGFDVGERLPMGQLIVSLDGTSGSADPATLALLGQGPPDLWDRRAFPLQPEEDQEVLLSLAERTRAWTRNDEVWHRDGAPDIAGFERVLSAEAVYRAVPPEEEPEWTGSLRITRNDGSERVVRVGTPVEGRVPLRDETGGEIYYIEQSGLERIFSDSSVEER